MRALDAQLARSGFHAVTPWWRQHEDRFHLHPTARRFVGRVGRGGIKSGRAVRFGVGEGLLRSWHVPPGERHNFVYVSIRSDEAAQRLRQLEAILAALHEPFTRSGDEIALTNRPLGFKVLPATIGGDEAPEDH